MAADKFKTNLLQDASYEQSNDGQNALYGKKYGKSKWKPKKEKSSVKCYECGAYGQITEKCSRRLGSNRKEANVSFSSLIAKSKSDVWFIDSAASAHTTMKRSISENDRRIHSGNVTEANNSTMAIQSSGDISMVNDICIKIIKNNVLYVPDSWTNLFSISRTLRYEKKVVFSGEKCIIPDKLSEKNYRKLASLIGTRVHRQLNFLRFAQFLVCMSRARHRNSNE